MMTRQPTGRIWEYSQWTFGYNEMTRPVTSFGVVSVASVYRSLAIRLGVHVCIKLSFVLRSFPEVVALVAYAPHCSSPNRLRRSRWCRTLLKPPNPSPLRAWFAAPTRSIHKLRCRQKRASELTTILRHSARTHDAQLGAWRRFSCAAVVQSACRDSRRGHARWHGLVSAYVLQRTWKAQCVTVMPTNGKYSAVGLCQPLSHKAPRLYLLLLVVLAQGL